MEVKFTYISGLEKEISEPVELLNEQAELFFSSKTYSPLISKIVFIIIPQDLNETEKKLYNSKYIKIENTVGIKLYVDVKEFLQNEIKETINYLNEFLQKSILKNLRLKKLEIDLNSFVTDLKIFFKQL